MKKSKLLKKIYWSIMIILFFNNNLSFAQVPPHKFQNLTELLNHVGCLCVGVAPNTDNRYIKFGVTKAGVGDYIVPDNVTDIDLDDITTITGICSSGYVPHLPIIVPAGATLSGNYDLIENLYTYTDNSGTYTIQTSPDGLLFHAEDFHKQYDLANSPGPGVTNCRSLMSFFTMEPGKTTNEPLNNIPTGIQHIRMRGSSTGWNEFNVGHGTGTDKLYSIGINIWRTCKFSEPIVDCTTNYGYNYKIANCEISGFSHSGIRLETYADQITVENCYIHHVKGISYEGIGYGLYSYGTTDPNNYINTGWNLTLKNTIFDDNKDAFDGSTGEFNQNFQHNTLTQFAGGINKHNNFDHNASHYYGYPGKVGSNDVFFSREHYYNCPNPPENKCVVLDNCIPIHSSFLIHDYSSGNLNIEGSIFHNNAGIAALPYPGNGAMNPDISYKISLKNNTMGAPHDLPSPTGCPANPIDLKHGYCTIADNYIENLVWDNDANIDFDSAPSSFDYRMGKRVVTDCPQPPEVYLNLLNALGTAPLPTTFNKSVTPGQKFTQFVNWGEAFTLSARAELDNKDLSYIIRKNPNEEEPVPLSTDDNTSGNNYFYQQEEVVNPGANILYLSTPYTYMDNINNPLPGLYGIDVLAVANSNGADWAQYNASAWQHIPLIVKPDVGDEKLLIFNIKDSYHEYHHNLAYAGCTPPCTTGIYKQVEFNDVPIWWEDIADGGDGWERVEVNMGGPIKGTVTNGNPSGTPVLSLINLDGKPNTLTFSIVIRDPSIVIPTDQVRGLLVWVDDVYLKKNEGADNLIADGSVELVTSTGPSNIPTANSAWYGTYRGEFKPCDVSRVQSGNEISEPLYPDGSRVVFNSVTTDPLSQMDVTKTDRKSGNQAVILKIPKLKSEATCDDYNQVFHSVGPAQPPGDIKFLVSAATDIDFTEFLTCDDYGQYNFEDLYTRFTSGLLPEAGHNYYLDRSLTINKDIDFEGNMVLIKPDYSIPSPHQVKITIQPNWKLTMRKVTTSGVQVRGCKFFSCSNMWGGIEAEAGGKIKITANLSVPAENNEIYDAVTALKSVGDHFIVSSTIFDRNLNAISLENTFDDANFNIFNNTFKCTAGAITKFPNIGKLPTQHILLQNVQGLDNASPLPIGIELNGNYFSGALKGIEGINSRFDVYSSDFSMPEPVQDPFESGPVRIGISATSTGTLPNPVLHLIPNSAHTSNSFSFKNLDLGVYTNNVPEVSIEKSSFTDCISGAVIMGGGNVTIKSNNFSNAAFGIGVYNSRTGHWGQYQTTVIGNTFNVGSRYAEMRFGTTSTAINVQNSIPSTNFYTVSGNAIFNTQIGIHTRNIPWIKIGLNSSDRNIIEYQMPAASINGPTQFTGVWVENCNYAQVLNNEVRWTGGTVNSGFVRGLRGVAIAASTKCVLKENKTTEMGAGINFFGDCTNTNLYCNTMQSCYHGVYLDPNGINNKLIDQGDINSQTAWKNKWVNNIDPLNHIGGANPSNFFSWLYKTGSATEFTPITQLGNINQLSVANEISSCSPPTFVNEQQRQIAYSDAVNDSTVNDPDSLDFKYNDKETFYKSAKADSSILYLGNSNDYKYQQEFDSLSQTNIGKYYEVKEHLQNDEKQQALMKLAGIVDDNLKEQNLKYVNEIIAINYNPSLDADSDTVSILANIAYLHPFYGGEAVYMARAILHLDVIDELPPLRRGHHQTINNSKQITVNGLLQPNPSSNEVMFTYPIKENETIELKLFDVYGKLALQYKTKQAATGFNVYNYVSGMYFLHVYIDGFEKEKHKLTVIK